MRFTNVVHLGTLLALPLDVVSSDASILDSNLRFSTLAKSGGGAILDIQQTLNLFPLSVDSKNYTMLADIFTHDARADFVLFPAGYGLPAIVAALSKSLAGLKSQHSFTTQVITLQNETDASAVTYLQGNFFLTGQVLNNYGKYVDDLTFVQDVGWRVRNRTLENFGDIGDLAILRTG